MMKNAFLLLLASASLSTDVLAFTTGPIATSRQAQTSSSSNSAVVLRLSPEEERAAVLSNYLAKSHEEKLKAVRVAEQMKDVEIKQLKEMLKESQASSGVAAMASPEPKAEAASGVSAALTISEPAADASLETMSPQDLVAMVQKYKHFVANYVADAQKQKAEAVKAAEEAMAQNFAASGAAAPVVHRSPNAPAPVLAAPKVPSTPADGTVYERRNALIGAAAVAGKSRWGAMELQTIAASNGAKTPMEAVEEADHGLRNDGGVGGLTLAERVAMGSEAEEGASAGSRSYDKRNQRIAEAAKVGKSRWGSMEIEKIRIYSGSVITNDAEIAAADHGLRNDGGVTGPSLSERVNLGAQLMAN